MAIVGGPGDDTYIREFGEPYYVIDESNGGGIDTIVSAYSVDFVEERNYYIGDFENITLMPGYRHIDAYGNSLSNSLTGNEYRNYLDGRGGDDIMRGRGGDDVYYIDSLGDLVDEAGGSGNDRVVSPLSVDLEDTSRFRGSIEQILLTEGLGLNMYGDSKANMMEGNATRNILDGRGGADLMRGLGGDDIYYVDHIGDVVDERFKGGGGKDQIFSSVSIDYFDSSRFKGDVERTTLLDGFAGLNIKGGWHNEVLTGNDHANTIDGRGGADSMRGGGGSDTYYVDHMNDSVDESISGSNGDDLVKSSVSVNLGSDQFRGQIERIALMQGYAGLDATGNRFDNTITGNAYGNHINGRGGNDTLSGGLGVDRFVFDTTLSATTNVDTITDFNVVDDKIELDDAIFKLLGGPGILSANRFKNEADGPIDADDRIIYNHLSGALTYDTNGSAAGGSTLFAWLPKGLAINNTDFVVI